MCAIARPEIVFKFIYCYKKTSYYNEQVVYSYKKDLYCYSSLVRIIDHSTWNFMVMQSEMCGKKLWVYLVFSCDFREWIKQLKRKEKGEKPSLLRALLGTFGVQYMLVGIVVFLEVCPVLTLSRSYSIILAHFLHSLLVVFVSKYLNLMIELIVTYETIIEEQHLLDQSVSQVLCRVA